MGRGRAGIRQSWSRGSQGWADGIARALFEAAGNGDSRDVVQMKLESKAGQSQRTVWRCPVVEESLIFKCALGNSVRGGVTWRAKV